MQTNNKGKGQTKPNDEIGTRSLCGWITRSNLQGHRACAAVCPTLQTLSQHGHTIASCPFSSTFQRIPARCNVLKAHHACTAPAAAAPEDSSYRLAVRPHKHRPRLRGYYQVCCIFQLLLGRALPRFTCRVSACRKNCAACGTELAAAFWGGHLLVRPGPGLPLPLPPLPPGCLPLL